MPPPPLVSPPSAHRPVAPREPVSLRESRSRSAVEALLAAATLVSLVRLAAAPGPPRDEPPLASIAVDVARDGPGRLRLLPGLGPSRVAAILADRRERGPVRRVEELARVRGIGPKTIDALLAAGAIARPEGESPESRP